MINIDDYKRKDPVFIKEDSDYAHVNAENKNTQSIVNHSGGAMYLAVKNCPLDNMRNTAKVTILLHDAGKFGQPYITYGENILQYGKNASRRQVVDHSSAGGNIAEEMMGEGLLSEFVSTAIYSHHSLQDCIEMETGNTLSEKRFLKEMEYQAVKNRYFQFIDEDILKEYIKAAEIEAESICSDINQFIESCGDKKCGSAEFYFGMYERLLLSLLIDSDWTDTACFFRGEPLPERISEARTQEIWEECISHFEGCIKQRITSGDESPLDVYRDQISERCFQAAQDEQRLYRLTVPAGAGRMLSSLCFALSHARKYHKRHIFYVAPHNSTLEWNADEIRKFVGNETYVLEHHCNVSYEKEEDEEEYRRLTENWDCPFVVVSATEILNTLFSDKKSSIRRMYNLCNSVIIFDEVQAFPERGTELFNLAVNFLTVFCNTTVVLCSATQPSCAALEENNLYNCKEMTENMGRYAEALKRAEIEDRTNMVPGGMEAEDLSSFALEELKKHKSVLLILNTKSCAQKVFETIKEQYKDEGALYHLSKKMCPENRCEELEHIKNDLADKKTVICVSTQLIESRVDLSFACVIRSLAGLDSIIRAAELCSCHKKCNENQTKGKTYIIRMAQHVENLNGLEEMQNKAGTMQVLLDYFGEMPEKFGGTIDSETALTIYYEQYFNRSQGKITKYPCNIPDTTLEMLLGRNETGRRQYARHHNGRKKKGYLNQAFQTAGRTYQVIPEDETVKIVIPYNQTAKDAIAVLEDEKISFFEITKALRKLQRYSVGISDKKKKELGKALSEVGDSGILVLDMDYYDQKEGVLDAPSVSEVKNEKIQKYD